MVIAIFIIDDIEIIIIMLTMVIKIRVCLPFPLLTSFRYLEQLTLP